MLRVISWIESLFQQPARVRILKIRPQDAESSAASERLQANRFKTAIWLCPLPAALLLYSCQRVEERSSGSVADSGGTCLRRSAPCLAPRIEWPPRCTQS